MDSRLDVKQKLCRITASSGEKLVEEIDEFEKQMDRNGVRLWKQWFHFFESALDDKPKNWISYSQTVEPGLSHYRIAMDPRTSADAWGAVYRLARAELYRAVGLNYETPGDVAQRLGCSEVPRERQGWSRD